MQCAAVVAARSGVAEIPQPAYYGAAAVFLRLVGKGYGLTGTGSIAVGKQSNGGRLNGYLAGSAVDTTVAVDNGQRYGIGARACVGVGNIRIVGEQNGGVGAVTEIPMPQCDVTRLAGGVIPELGAVALTGGLFGAEVGKGQRVDGYYFGNAVGGVHGIHNGECYIVTAGGKIGVLGFHLGGGAAVAEIPVPAYHGIHIGYRIVNMELHGAVNTGGIPVEIQIGDIHNGYIVADAVGTACIVGNGEGYTEGAYGGIGMCGVLVGAESSVAEIPVPTADGVAGGAVEAGGITQHGGFGIPGEEYTWLFGYHNTLNGGILAGVSGRVGGNHEHHIEQSASGGEVVQRVLQCGGGAVVEIPVPTDEVIACRGTALVGKGQLGTGNDAIAVIGGRCRGYQYLFGDGIAATGGIGGSEANGIMAAGSIVVYRILFRTESAVAEIPVPAADGIGAAAAAHKGCAGTQDAVAKGYGDRRNGFYGYTVGQ